MSLAVRNHLRRALQDLDFAQVSKARAQIGSALMELQHLERKNVAKDAEIAELRAKGSQLPSLKEIKDAVRESGFATHEQCWQIANDVLAMLSARPQQPKGESNVE